jgi:hypothetical protein
MDFGFCFIGHGCSFLDQDILNEAGSRANSWVRPLPKLRLLEER